MSIDLEALGLGLAQEELSRPALLVRPAAGEGAGAPGVAAAAPPVLEEASTLEAAIAELVEVLGEDVALAPRGRDVAGQLTALGEAQELAAGDRNEAELSYRRALQADARAAEAQESLRRLHRTAGNWRTVAQLLAREIAATDGPRRAQLQLTLELLGRARPEANITSPLTTQTLDATLPPVWGRLEGQLRATHALGLRSVDRVLALRAELGGVDLESDTSRAGASLEALQASEAWAWSNANLRRFLLKDGRGAAAQLQALFDHGRRDPELLEALEELLEEQREWDRLRAVLEEAVAGQGSAVEFEALASLLEHRFRDLDAAAEVLRAGVERFPEDATLARRHVEALAQLQQQEGLIDALGNLLEATSSRAERAELLFRMGRLFEEVAGNTSAAMEVFHEAIAALPHHGPTLRALGRIYTRQNNWYGLADLYEKELAAPAPLPDAWRRHLRLAELYEEKHANPTAALRHYLAVLQTQPTSPPALEGAARLYAAEGEWLELVRLYSGTARRLKSRRRQIDLLERAARAAEEHLDNDRLLAELLGRLLELDAESTWAAARLGALYERTAQWEPLLQLLLREASYAEDGQETAHLFWRCGRLAELRLGDTARAEAFYRESLGAAPDFTPALGALGRLLIAEGREEELLGLSEAELEVLDDAGVKLRRMEAMAELLEQRLGRRAAAIDLYERILEADGDDTSAVERLLTLYAEQGRWEQVAELVERKANSLEDAADAAEQWFRLGELRERRLSDPRGALDAWDEGLVRDPDHAHALRGVLRLPAQTERDRDAVLARVSQESATAPIRRLALRHLARRAELSSDNPLAGLEHRRAAVTLDPDDREARDMLEAACASRRDLPALAGLWAAAGRTVDEGLLGLLCAGVGIDAAALLETFLNRWGDGLQAALAVDGRREVWSAALSELSRGGMLALGARATPPLLATLPAAVRRRMALAELGANGRGAAAAQQLLPLPALSDPASLRLRAALVREEPAARIAALRAEVDQLRSPELRVRRLLELAQLDPPRRAEDLRRAAGQEAYDSPVQELLYEALEDAELWALLGEALEGHLCAEDLGPQRRSLLAYRLGRAIEQRDGDPLEALNAYRTSFMASNDRHEALLDIARLALQHGDKWDVIRSLEAFMTLSPDLDKRLDAGRFLAKMYLAEADRPPEESGYNPYAGPVEFDGGIFGRKAVTLLSQLREEVRGTPHEAGCTSQLAHAHAEIGSPYKAVELFLSLLTGEVEEAQIPDYVALASLYEEPLGDLANAEQVLWLVWDTFPQRRDLLERLLNVSRAKHSTADTCTRVERTARVAAPEILTAADRRALLEQVATIQGEELGRWRAAAALWAELADGASDAARRRTLRVRQAQALCRVTGEESRCHALMLELHREDPLELAPYEGLETLYRELDDHERLRTVQQIRYVLDPAAAGSIVIDQVRLKTRPTRAFEPDLLHAQLLPEGLRGGVLGVLQALVPLVVKIWGEGIPTVEALGGRRLKTGELDQVVEMANTAAATFGMPKIKLLMGDSGPGTPQVFSGSVPTLWYHRGMFDGFGPEVARFWTGYAAAMAWSGLSPLTHIDGRDVWHLLEGVLIKQLGVALSEITDPRSNELAEAVGGVFNASFRKRVAELAAPCLNELRQAHCEAWPAMIHVMAMRAGLVLSGQLSGAVQAVLRGRQWRGELHDRDTQDHLRRLPEIADLLRFALGEEYQTLRYGCGLSARARRMMP